MLTNVKELDFSQFAFTADSEWGKCITSFLNQIYRKSNSLHSLEHYRSYLQSFFSLSPRRLPHLYMQEDIVSFVTAPGKKGTGCKSVPSSSATQNNRLSALNSLYKFAASYGITGPDGMLYPLFPYLSPTANVRCPAIKP